MKKRGYHLYRNGFLLKPTIYGVTLGQHIWSCTAILFVIIRVRVFPFLFLISTCTNELVGDGNCGSPLFTMKNVLPLNRYLLLVFTVIM